MTTVRLEVSMDIVCRGCKKPIISGGVKVEDPTEPLGCAIFCSIACAEKHKHGFGIETLSPRQKEEGKKS
jgi:hypothetical protein